jgi:hypothetical protein
MMVQSRKIAIPYMTGPPVKVPAPGIIQPNAQTASIIPVQNPIREARRGDVASRAKNSGTRAAQESRKTVCRTAKKRARPETAALI